MARRTTSESASDVEKKNDTAHIIAKSYASFEEEQGYFEVDDQMWRARDRAIIAKTKQYL